jgi:hypothetical protein
MSASSNTNNTMKSQNNKVVTDFKADSPNIEFTVPKQKKNASTGTTSVNAYILYAKQPLLLETPYLVSPFGVGSYSKGKSDNMPKAYSVNVSAQAADEADQEKVDNFFSEMIKLENKMVDFGLKNSQVVFGKKYDNEHVVRALFTGFVRVDAEGKYPARIAPKIPETYETRGNNGTANPNINVYREETNDKGAVTFVRCNPDQKGYTFNDLEAHIVPRTVCKVIFKFRFWIANGKFGFSPSVVQLLFRKKEEQGLLNFAFSSEGKVETNVIETKMEALAVDKKPVTKTVTKNKATEEVEDSDGEVETIATETVAVDEEEEDDEAEDTGDDDN